MKVFDIISEEPYVSSPGGIAIPASTQAAIDADAAQAEIDRRAAARGARVAKRDELQFRKDNPITAKSQDLVKSIKNAKKAVGDFKSDPVTPTAEAIKKKINALRTRQKIGDTVIDHKLIKNKGQRLMLQRVGGAMTILRLIGAASFVLEYWEQVAYTDAALELYQKGDTENGISPEVHQMAIRLQREELIVNLAASAFLPKAIRIVMGIITGAKWASRLLGAAAAPFTAGVSIAAILASEAATIAIQAYLSSEDGKKAVAHIVANYIDPAIPKTGIEMLNTKLKSIETQAKTDTKATPGAAPAAQTGNPDADDIAKRIGVR